MLSALALAPGVRLHHEEGCKSHSMNLWKSNIYCFMPFCLDANKFNHPVNQFY